MVILLSFSILQEHLRSVGLGFASLSPDMTAGTSCLSREFYRPPFRTPTIDRVSAGAPGAVISLLMPLAMLRAYLGWRSNCFKDAQHGADFRLLLREPVELGCFTRADAPIARSFDLYDFLERPQFVPQKPRNGWPRHQRASDARDYQCYLGYLAARASAASTYSNDLSRSYARSFVNEFPRVIRAALHSLTHRYSCIVDPFRH